MSYRLNSLICNKSRNLLIQESRKYAGHSKWQNIKHTKQEHDSAKSTLFRTIIHKMKVTAEETGNSDPASNPRLANLIDQARKVNMPTATLRTALDRLQNQKESSKIHIMTISGPAGVHFILYIASNNFIGVKLAVKHITKKFNFKCVDSTILNTFDCASYIIAFKDCNLDQAMEDAIEADAEDLEEIKYDGDTCFQFKGEFLFPDKTVTRLKSLGYIILTTESKCTPISTVEVDKESLESINKFQTKLLSEIKEIKKIEHNLTQL